MDFVPLGRPLPRRPPRRDRRRNAIGTRAIKHFSPKVGHMSLDKNRGAAAKEKRVGVIEEIDLMELERLKNAL